MIISPSRKIVIVSHHGENKISVIYDGKYSQKAIKRRLTLERCSNLDVSAIQYSHEIETGLKIGRNLETDELVTFPNME